MGPGAKVPKNSTSKSSVKNDVTRAASFREYESQLSTRLISENELPSVPHSLHSLCSPLCLIAVFILSVRPRLVRPRAFHHMFSIVWIKVKWILGHYADWKCSTPLGYNVILKLCLLGHNCCVFCVSLSFEGQLESINTQEGVLAMEGWVFGCFIVCVRR